MHHNDPKKFWRLVKSLTPSQKSEILELKDEKTKLNIPFKELANHINTYFTDIGPILANEFNTTANLVNDPVPRADEHKPRLAFYPPEQNEIETLLMKISEHKSSGLNQLKARLVKDALKHISASLTKIYSQCINNGVFPDKWKIATVVPIPKVAIPFSANQLRPISLLLVPGKV